MGISTKGRYALRLMVDLAIHKDGGYTPIKAVSQRESISEKYLEQIITQISRAGFVTGVRGPSGGYKLSMEPKDYTVGMILRQVEGSLSPVFCVDTDENECERCEICSTVDVWKAIRDAINGVVDSITLEDLANRTKARTKEQAI